MCVVFLMSLFQHLLLFALKNKKQVDYIVRLCSKIAGIQLDELSLFYRCRVTREPRAVVA